MEITTNKNELLLSLSKVIAAVNPKSTLPILSNVLIETQKNCIILIGTDLEIGISTTINADIKAEGNITLPAKKFMDIVRELPDKEVSIEVSKNNSVSIQSGKAYFKLMGLPKDDFPKFPKIDREYGIKIDGSVLKEAIRLTSFAISTDETRYVLNGALMEIKDNTLRLVATDGRRLALLEKNIKVKANTNINFIIPAKAMNELNKNIDENGSVFITDLGNQVVFHIDNFFIISRLIEGHFPNYKQVIPDESLIKVTLDRQKFYSTIKRVSLLTSLEAQAIKIDILKGDKMILSSKSPNLGESKEDIALDMKQGGEITIGFNPNYILDVLKNLDVDKVTLSLSVAERPGIIDGKEGYTYVIMPMQII